MLNTLSIQHGVTYLQTIQKEAQNQMPLLSCKGRSQYSSVDVNHISLNGTYFQISVLSLIHSLQTIIVNAYKYLI